jgi:hypothetical protein
MRREPDRQPIALLRRTLKLRAMHPDQPDRASHRARRQRLVLSTALLLLAACSADDRLPATVGDLAYRCDDGHVVRVLVEPEWGRAVLTTSRDALTLRAAPADVGNRFVAPGWEFWAVGEEALFSRPGSRQTRCRYHPWFDS